MTYPNGDPLAWEEHCKYLENQPRVICSICGCDEETGDKSKFWNVCRKCLVKGVCDFLNGTKLEELPDELQGPVDNTLGRLVLFVPQILEERGWI